MEPFYFKFISMTTPCVIQIYMGTAENAERCFKEIKKNTLLLEKKYNFFNNRSYLNKIINRRKEPKVKLDKQTYDVLKIIRQLSKDTNGIFDISMGTLKQCYKKQNLVESEQCLEQLSSKTGLDSWDLDSNGYISFKYPETLIDLGGVIKEFAVDEAVNIVRKFGIKSAIVNFGGDIHVVGKKPDGKEFAIGIKNPKNPEKNLVIVNLNNQALTTSASYERSITIEGKTFSHIIGVEEKKDDILSATIISDSTLKCGVYSTSFMMTTNIEIPDDLKVVLVDSQLQLHQNLQ